MAKLVLYHREVLSVNIATLVAAPCSAPARKDHFTNDSQLRGFESEARAATIQAHACAREGLCFVRRKKASHGCQEKIILPTCLILVRKHSEGKYENQSYVKNVPTIP